MRYLGSPFRFNITPWVKRLLIANAAVFVVTLLAPPVLRYLAFEPARTLTQPWGLLTYMFVHAGFFHLFFNMLILFFFGPPLEERWGSREFIKYYLICGLGGAALQFLFAPTGYMVGASAAIFGVMLAFAMNWPDSPIYIWGILPIKAKWLVVFLTAINLMGAAGGGGGVTAHFAHLGGLVFGFVYLKLDAPATGRLGRWKKLLSRPRLIVVSGDKPQAKEQPRRSRRRDEDHLLDEVDRVLDKISNSGLSSLSAEERKLLDEVSKRYRQN